MSEYRTANFNGFKQVTLEYFNTIEESERKGYIWFVRSNIGTDTDGNVTYDSDIYFGNRLYAHYSNDVNESIDAIIDILSDAGLVDDSGNTVNISDLLESAKYEDGIAVTISGGTISVNVADETENVSDTLKNRKNFLKVNSNNELEVKGMDADSTVTTDEITIAGGPLADKALMVYSDGKLPSGTSLQDFLLSMLCVEKWPENVIVSDKFVATIPSITLEVKDVDTKLANNASVEIGTVITLNEIRKKESEATQSITVDTMDYGYKIGVDGEHSNDTVYTQELVPIVSDETVTIKLEFTGITNDTIEDSVSSKIDEMSLTVVDGVNTIKCTQEGKTYKASADVSEDSIYVATNLMNYYKEDKNSDNIVNIVTPSKWVEGTEIKATKTASFTINGKRNSFYGYITETPVPVKDINSTIVRDLQYKTLSIGNSFEIVTEDDTREIVIAIPSSLSKKISKVTDRNASEAVITGNFLNDGGPSRVVSVESANGFDSADYDLWVWTPATSLDANVYTITLE